MSHGIICCKKFNSGYKVLMVRKRHTYAYSDFIHGKYTNDDRSLGKLFNKMTADEKSTIHDLNFEQIWDRIWKGKRTPIFKPAAERFRIITMRDGGKRIRSLLENAIHGETTWEVPKGRKAYPSETDLACAMREFYEETGVNDEAYKLFIDAQASISHHEAGTCYITNYFFARALAKAIPKVDILNSTQIEEISDIKWMSLKELDTCDSGGQLFRKVQAAVHYIRATYAPKW